jgi:hypothetical protein
MLFVAMAGAGPAYLERAQDQQVDFGGQYRLLVRQIGELVPHLVNQDVDPSGPAVVYARWSIASSLN